MKLPLLVSVPHAGLEAPPQVRPYLRLTAAQIAEDGDEQAREIYTGIAPLVAAFVTTEIARAVVDLNRAEHDRRKDGVVKTHTCWGVPVYDPFPPESVITELLDGHYRPYHRRLRELATADGVRLGIDCHTMAAEGPPVGPDPGRKRPAVCLGDGGGRTCPAEWMEALVQSFRAEFGDDVQVNEPFKGGFITLSHAADIPWVQLELSRAPFLPVAEKAAAVERSLRGFCAEVFGPG